MHVWGSCRRRLGTWSAIPSVVTVERISLGSLRQSLRITVALSLILVLFSVGYGVPISQYVSIYSLIYYEQRSLRDRSTTR